MNFQIALTQLSALHMYNKQFPKMSSEQGDEITGA